MKLRSVRIMMAAWALGLGAWATASAAELPLALDGKCTVCLAKMNKLVDGKAAFTSDYDGKTYRFPSDEQKKMFDADPAKFVPALGGDCVVCLVEMGKRVAGKPEHALVHDGRLFLFPAQEQLDMFKKNPAKYADADLALGGNCPVCLVKMNKVVKGDPKYAVVHDGLRYLFPSAEQKAMFEKSPAAFTPALGGNCVVCKVEMKKAVPGKAEFFAVHDDRLFLFPSQKQLDMFNADPHKYKWADVALGGKCVVCKVEMKKDVPGSEKFAADYHGKRYLFPDGKTRDRFLARPDRYARE
ncbi:MAG: hypothetical protein HBSAPP02_27140 [Phycisphaerae bacterium]|nr:MAG: hypothetical protein HRU71_01515 [Planctomycetia bacterium]GJQ27682.1 MAG: hypothetical protein HBSAPP02_27140 [Phycisphaerae bacterium]